MAVRKTKPSLTKRTPVAEWVAAGAGLVLTVAVIGYTVWEGATEDHGPPKLSLSAAPPVATRNGYVVAIVVRNASHETAAQVEVRGVVSNSAGPPEERRANFAYVPGRGEARGGLVFEREPTAANLALSVEGFADP